MGGIYEYKDFYAIQPTFGPDRALRIGGTVVFRSGGWKARLKRDESGPIPISPHSPRFSLVVTKPTDGATDQLEEVKLDEYRDENPSHEFLTMVLFNVRDEEGNPTDYEPPPRLLLEHPQE